eukprot:Gb_36405 [translate_table: standard]
MFDFAYQYKLNAMWKEWKHERAAPLLDKFVFSKVKESLGGRVRIVLSGAAPLARNVEEFLRVVSCSHVVQGYDLTETCTGTFVPIPNVMSMHGTVGPPIPNVDVCLNPIPEMGCDALGQVPRGESDGALKIIDRRKNIFKLSQGEYIAVENLENVYGLCHVIDSIWVYGNSFEMMALALSSGFFKEISCSKNLHIKEYRLMSIKDIADVVEALIGAYLDAAGEIAALNFMGWLEALTHASYQGPLVSGCYQRLQFLGGGVLDYLITSYLYKRHPRLSPGVLTDLKSAAVNNDCYAQAAVKCGLHRQLHHASSMLHRQITDFVKVITSCLTPAGHLFGWTSSGSVVPKVLGDLIESIAGAILVDSGFETELVWNATQPLLEPIVMPDKLTLYSRKDMG